MESESPPLTHEVLSYGESLDGPHSPCKKQKVESSPSVSNKTDEIDKPKVKSASSIFEERWFHNFTFCPVPVRIPGGKARPVPLDDKDDHIVKIIDSCAKYAVDYYNEHMDTTGNKLEFEETMYAMVEGLGNVKYCININAKDRSGVSKGYQTLVRYFNMNGFKHVCSFRKIPEEHERWHYMY